MRERWYSLTEEELMQKLQTNAEKGLSSKEAAERLKTDGKNNVNAVYKEPKRAYLRRIFSDLTTVLMLASALLALLYRRDAGMIAILALVFFGYLLSILSYVRAQKTLEDLGQRALPTAKVQRRGKLMVIPAEDVVMGDILYLSHGDVVPCDARLLETEELRVLEGSLFPSGRATPKDASFLYAGILKPSQTPNMVYASTVVTSGRGKAVAVETGEDTLVCRMGRSRPIGACHKLDAVKTVRALSSLLGIVLLIPVFVLTVRELAVGGRLIEALLTGLTFASASLCEFYSAYVYTAIAVSARAGLTGGRKNAKTVFIKNPLALSDLTDLNCVFLPLESFRVPGEARLSEIFNGSQTQSVEWIGKKESYLRILRYGILSTGLYGGARLTQKNERSENIYTPEQEALISFAEEKGIYNRSLDDHFPILDHRDVGEGGSLFETTMVRSRGEDVVVLRGEARAVLENCTSYNDNGKVYDMDATAFNELMNVAQTMMKNNCTPVAVATKISRYNTLTRIVDCQSDLTFEGFLAIEKTLLPGAAMQIEKLRQAGVRVIAYTAEEHEDLEYLANALGIVKKPGECIRFPEFAAMSEGVFRAQAETFSFYEGFDAGRLKQIVDALREDYKWNVGFMSGRLEDAYPMYASNVGFSVEDGTKLTGRSKKSRDLRSPLWMKNAGASDKYSCQALNHISDVILPLPTSEGNGGLNSISCAIGTARTVYKNIRQFLCYLIFTCGMRLTALCLGSTGGVLTPVQMLVSGMVFDLLAVFVLVFERFDKALPEKQKTFSGVGAALRTVAPYALLGVLSFLAAFLTSKILVAAGVLAEDNFTSFCFTQLLLTQFAFLSVLLRSGKPPFRDLRATGAFGVYLTALAGFFALCFAIPAAGELFALTFPGAKAFAAAFILPLLVCLIGVILRAIRGVGKRRAGKKKKK